MRLVEALIAGQMWQRLVNAAPGQDVLLVAHAGCVLATSAELVNEPLSGPFALHVVHTQHEPDWSRASQATITQFARTGRFVEEPSCRIPLRVLGAR